MAARILCPSCGKAFNDEKDRDPVRWKKEGCPRCRREAVADASSRPTAARKRRDAEDEDEERPRRRPSRRDDDEHERPRRKKSQEGSSRTMLLVGLGGGGLLLVGLVVVLLIVFLRSPDEPTKTDSTQVTANPDGVPNPKPGGQPNPNPDPKPNQKPDPQPVKVPDKLADADVIRVKNATVYLRVQLPKGEVAQGSGFLCSEPGIVMTNAHVLGMLRSDALPPSQVDVVVHHGEPNELRLAGQVVAVDRNNDLAVLRVPVTPQLPQPLAVESADKLIETQKVYVFGFPLGVQLGKNITVSESSVSSLRRDESGELTQVQVNGGMQPGNSGGPVTDARGVVIGVSVSIIRGTQLNFAVPGDYVLRLLNGEFSYTELGAPYRSAQGTVLLLKANCLDPLGRIRDVKVEVWAGAPGDARLGSAREPAARAGDGPRVKYQLTLRDGAYWADVPLPALQAGQVCWMQPVLVNGAGAPLWDKATPMANDALIVLDRRPATIRVVAPTGDVVRSIRMTNTQTFSLYRSDKDVISYTQKLDGPVLESLNPDKRPGNLGTAVRLTIGSCSITRETPRGKLNAPAEAVATLSRCTPTFLVDRTNLLKERGNPDFRTLAPRLSEYVENFYEMVCNTYESTTLPVPNREVQPLESWPARAPMLVTDEDNKKVVQDIFLTCTYQGLWSAAGHNEAYIALAGEVKNRGPRPAVLGKVTGFALLDVDKGYFSRVKMVVYSEVELDARGVRMMLSEASLVVRTEGNTLGIKPK